MGNGSFGLTSGFSHETWDYRWQISLVIVKFAIFATNEMYSAEQINNVKPMEV